MPTVSDARFDALRDQGFTGATNDMLLQWLLANGATTPALPDAWAEMLIAQGYDPYQRNDSWYAFLGDLGYTGSISDREIGFWGDGGLISADGVRITQQPLNWLGDVGGTAVFSVVATSGDASPLTYQWQEFVGGAWQNVVDGGNISGATTANLTGSPVAFSDRNRKFRVVVTNATNSLTSRSANLVTN